MSGEGASVTGVHFDGSYSRLNSAGGPIGSLNNTTITGTLNYNAAPPPKPAPAPRCPPASPNFVGREEEQQAMWQFFFGSGVRLDKRRIYSVVGIGGCGKTQLCRQFTDRVYKKFAKRNLTHLVFYVDGTTEATLEASFALIAKANGLEASSEAALAWISNLDQEFFLYIDNADDPKINLRPFFSNSSHARVLITTRLPEKAKYYGTGPGSRLQLDSLSEGEAVSLLERTVEMSEERISREKDLIVTLVKELYCHPLAVVQAGACMSKSRWTVQHYLDKFHTLRTSLLDGKNDRVESAAIDDYPLHVHTTWRLSYDILSPRAQTLLSLCAHLHHTGITEQLFQESYYHIFKSAFASPTVPYSEQELDAYFQLVDFLSQFVVNNGSWDADEFRWCMQEACSSSLLSFDESTQYSIHPLVHDSLRSLELTGAFATSVALAAAISTLWGDELALQRLLPHAQHVVTSWSPEERSSMAPEILLYLSRVFYETGRYIDTEQLQQLHLTRLQRDLGADHLETISALGNLANTLREVGRHNEAELAQRGVLEKRQRILGTDHLDTIGAMSNLANTLAELGRYDEAELAQSEVLEKRQRILGSDHSGTIRAMNNLANTLVKLGRLAEAELAQRKVLEKRLRNLRPDHLDTIRAMNNLANTLVKLGRLPEAEVARREVLQKRQRILGPDHPETISAMNNLACTLRDLGRYDEAEPAQREVLRKRRQILGLNRAQTAWAMSNLARTLSASARSDEAKRLFQQAVDIMRSALGAEHPSTLRVQGYLRDLEHPSAAPPGTLETSHVSADSSSASAALATILPSTTLPQISLEPDATSPPNDEYTSQPSLLSRSSPPPTTTASVPTVGQPPSPSPTPTRPSTPADQRPTSRVKPFSFVNRIFKRRTSGQ